VFHYRSEILEIGDNIDEQAESLHPPKGNKIA
jgi:hypothetical protein